jgi:acetyl esterase/lipase
VTHARRARRHPRDRLRPVHRRPAGGPLYADLTGLPPLLIQVGTIETLLDDAMRLAERARAAGVAVTLEEHPDMPHVWHMFGSFLPEAQ